MLPKAAGRPTASPKTQTSMVGRTGHRLFKPVVTRCQRKCPKQCEKAFQLFEEPWSLNGKVSLAIMPLIQMDVSATRILNYRTFGKPWVKGSMPPVCPIVGVQSSSSWGDSQWSNSAPISGWIGFGLIHGPSVQQSTKWRAVCWSIGTWLDGSTCAPSLPKDKMS